MKKRRGAGTKTLRAYKGDEMAKEKEDPRAEAPAVVKMIHVTRNGKQCFGGPTEAEIPETSLPSWAKNGWTVTERQGGLVGLDTIVKAAALLCLCVFLAAIGRGVVPALAEVWNSTQTFNEPAAFTDTATFSSTTTLDSASTFTVEGAQKKTPAVKTASFTVSTADGFYEINSSGGAITATLPDPSTCTGSVWHTYLKTAGNAVTFNAGTFSINGAVTDANMDAAGDTYTIYCNGAGYVFLSRYIH